jgi:hypothetical protein
MGGDLCLQLISPIGDHNDQRVLLRSDHKHTYIYLNVEYKFLLVH